MSNLPQNLHLLNAEQGHLYKALGIFPLNTPIPQQTVLQFWKHIQPNIDTHEQLSVLLNLHLIEQTDDTITNLFPDYTKAQLSDSYVQTHQDFLASYKINNWSNLAIDETYLWYHVVYHLTESQQTQPLYSLLLDYSWLQAKLNATDIDCLVADCDTFLKVSSNVDQQETIQLMRSMFVLSENVLRTRKDQLPYQIVGRLWTHRHKAIFASLWQTCHTMTPLELLETQLYPPMFQAGGALLRVIEDQVGGFQLKNGNLLTWDNKNLSIRTGAGDLLATLTGHESFISYVKELSDGSILSYSQGKIIFWSKEGKLLLVRNINSVIIFNILELISKQILLWNSSSPNKYNLELWNLEHGSVKVLNEDIKNTTQLQNGNILLFRHEKTAHLWNSECTFLTELQGHTDDIINMLELKDSRILSWAKDKTIRFWNNGGELLTTLDESVIIVGALELRDHRILSWAEDHRLQLRNSQGTLLTIMEGHSNTILNALELSTGRILSWSEDCTLRLWSSEGELIKVLEGHIYKRLRALELKDGRIISYGDYIMRLWSATGDLLGVLVGHSSSVMKVSELDNGQILSSSWFIESTDITLKFWDLKRISSDLFPEPSARFFIPPKLSTGRILSSSQTGRMRLWSSEGELLNVLEGHSSSMILTLELSTKNILSYSYYGSKENVLRLWNQDGELLKVLEGHTDSITSAIELSNGTILSIAGNYHSIDHTLRLWSLQGEPLAVLQGHTGGVWKAFELSNGLIVSLAWQDDNLRLWNKQGESIAVLSGHTRRIHNIIQLSDQRLLSWSEDNTIRFWSQQGELLAVLEGHLNNVWDVKQLSNGYFISRGYQGFFLWSLEGKLVKDLLSDNESTTSVFEFDDKHILSWEQEKIVKLWSETGQLLDVFIIEGSQMLQNTPFNDGRLLLRTLKPFNYELFELWSKDGILIDTLMNDGKVAISAFNAWEQKHNIDMRPLFEHDSDDENSAYTHVYKKTSQCLGC
jgi:hypothetical protein